MRSRQDTAADKLRGGFYTPAPLVAFCYERITELLPLSDKISVLEPSAGDGAFVRGAAEAHLDPQIERIYAIEPTPAEAAKLRAALGDLSINGQVHQGSAVTWAAETGDLFDAAVGNPPFLRYQFISSEDRDAILALGRKLHAPFRGVSNLWIPLLLGALSRLRVGGAFAFVVPTECFTGLSAEAARGWLVQNCDEVRFDFFPPGSFPDVLQEVAVLSGTRAAGNEAKATVEICEHSPNGSVASWSHLATTESGPWTRLLLGRAQLDALSAAKEAEGVCPLTDLAAFEVSIVTGANDFFSVDDATLDGYSLAAWARPLLPRIRHAPGLVFTAADHAMAAAAGARAWLLDFGADSPDPEVSEAARRYLLAGEERHLPGRYKCRIREPWYRVPNIQRGELFMSKRSHHFPRVVLNEAGSYTTDTIYRGRMRPSAVITAGDLAAGFHSSLTLLTAELEGRSFGGGVLELVPSEIARLSVAAVCGLARHLPRLDAAAREGQYGALVTATDALLIDRGVLDREIVARLAEARAELLARRLERNRRQVALNGAAGGSAEGNGSGDGETVSPVGEAIDRNRLPGVVCAAH